MSLGRHCLCWGYTQVLTKQSLEKNTNVLCLLHTETFSSKSFVGFGKDIAEGSSVNPDEAEKFAKLSNSWWNERGPFKPLHAMNRARCEFIKHILDIHACRFLRKGTLAEPAYMRVLDVGCGGGILSESLATMKLCSNTMRLHVTGIDVHDRGIQAAIQHRNEVLIPSTRSEAIPPILEYRLQSIEGLLETETDGYDIVIASEVIEHVDSVEEFCRNIVRATKPSGRIIMSTLNRTFKSYLLAILGAEYITGMVPQGTHEWNKFITPQELVRLLCDGEDKVSLDMLSGMSYQPLTGLWHLSHDTNVNYIASYSVDQ